MAAATIPIPLDVLTVGTHTYGPATVDDDVTQGTITVDRTVSRGQTQGFNGQPATTTAELAIWQSSDGGATWDFRASAGIVGGTYLINEFRPEDGPHLFSDITVELTPGTGRRVRADVTVAGDRVAVAGSLAIV